MGDCFERPLKKLSLVRTLERTFFYQTFEKVTIHQKNLQNLATEMFKVKYNLAPEVMTEVFRLKTRPFNTRNKFEFQRRN